MPYTQVTEHLLGATEDGVELVRAVEHFNDAAHAGLGEAAAAKDLDRLVGDLVGGARGGHFEQADGAAEVARLLLVRHVAHLVRDGLEPRLVRLDEGDHLGQLLADDGLVDQALAKDDALVGPLETLLDDGSHVANGAA